MLKRSNSYDRVQTSFRWAVPEFYNIGVDICDKWASDPDRTALIHETGSGEPRRWTFRELRDLSNKLANGLEIHGIRKGDRVAILLGQGPETALTHIAVYKLGAIAIPMFTLFGPEALEYRLSNSGASAVITDAANIDKILEIWNNLPELRLALLIDGRGGNRILNFWELIDKGSSFFEPVATKADDPALIIYTSGTTGPPKGALHAHRVLLGHLPGVEFPHNFFPQKDDLFWTPADWAWIGGLIDVLFPSWSHGVPVVAYRARKFDPEEVFQLIEKHHIRNAFMPPTALKLMRQVPDPGSRYNLKMRSIGSGGETLGTELLNWAEGALGVKINEFYGQTEANLLIGNCFEIMEIKPGSMGKTIPGHTLAIVDESGKPTPLGQDGEIAVKSPDPVMFLGYWNNLAATQDKFRGDWLLTGDLARIDKEGYFWFVGRKDDVITSGGYRIGPAEIEDCILKHPVVSMVAVVGSPDPIRTEIVKAFIVLKEGVNPGSPLEQEIKEFVRVRLAAHEFPREIEFVDDLPKTATGKIMRKELKKLEIERAAIKAHTAR
ncbi:MAG: acyl-CoA synthetase [Deltaproteobacteria bacterium]|nr:acyl-CoA synthetase [Deltaproteobacteria bacterium]